jgi:DUF2934 family protein
VRDNELHVTEVPDGLVVAGVSSGKTVMTEAVGFVASQSAGEWGMGTYTGARLAPTPEEIAQLAYELYESRGGQDGNDLEDWLRAEQQLFRHYA